MPLGESFHFRTRGDDILYTYEKVGTGTKVSWYVQGEWHDTDCYGISTVRDYIKRGVWAVVPSEPTQTTEQSSENAFKALEDVVRNHKQLNMENGSTIEICKVGDLMKAAVNIPASASKECVEVMHTLIANFNEPMPQPLLEAIKAFTASGKYNVAVYKGGYTVYCPNDEYRASSDKQLVEVMRALETLEGCVGN